MNKQAANDQQVGGKRFLETGINPTQADKYDCAFCSDKEKKSL